MFVKPILGSVKDYHTIYKVTRYDHENDAHLEEWGIHIRGPNEMCFLIFDTFQKSVIGWMP